MICIICKKSKPVKLATYLDEDQIRQEGLMCDLCIGKAKAAKAFIGYGGLEDNQ